MFPSIQAALRSITFHRLQVQPQTLSAVSFSTKIMTDNTDILEELMAIAIPITATDRSQAQTFAEQQPTQVRAEQVYRNTIAVLVTHRCLQLLGIKSDLERSNSWNPLNRLVEDVADLYIPEVEGHLECRPIRLGDSQCFIPEDVRSDRLGYVVVQLDDADREGQVLGFVASASTTELLLSDLQPLDALIDRLCPIPTHLGEWLKQKFDSGWEPCDHLLRPQKQSILSSALRSRLRNKQDEIKRRVEQLHLKQANRGLPSKPIPSIEPEAALIQMIQSTQDDEIRWQAAELLWQLNSQHPACPVVSAKDLGIYLQGCQVALVVGVLPKADETRLILLRLYPIDPELRLPPGLKLIGLDETGNQVFQVESRQQDDCIQFKITADEGDRFNVRVVLNDASFTESFVV
jgi:hypothetical protein